MEQDLWTQAKLLAHAKGRREDWIYVVQLYRSMGGKDMRVFIYTNGDCFEILGEMGEGKILALDKYGDEQVLDRSIYSKSRKRFKKESPK